MPEAPLNQTVKDYGYIFYAMKAKNLVKLEGMIKVPSLESAQDTVRLVMMRDSRITQGFVVDPTTKEVLWAALPGLIREQLEKAGFGQEVLAGISGRVPPHRFS